MKKGCNMVDYKVEEYHVGAIGTNCYFLINNETKEMLVIDPGGNGEMLIAKIEEAGLKPVAILQIGRASCRERV